jgi:hypothetical protein
LRFGEHTGKKSDRIKKGSTMAEVIKPGQIEAGRAAQSSSEKQQAEGVSPLPFHEAKQERYIHNPNQADEDKALSPERESLYNDLTGVGESGTQGDVTGREDQNPIGRISTPATESK